MQSYLGRLALVACGIVGIVVTACRTRSSSTLDAGSGDDPLMASYLEGFGYEDHGLSENAQKGRRIWYFATAGNARHHSYILPQKIGALADYGAVFSSRNRGVDRFKKWGVIPDPSCITAQEAEQRYPGLWGDSGLNAETYGFDVCPGDMGAGGLIAAIGKPGAWENDHWRNDPGCALGDCALQLGTSTGGLGFRKFPNPKFNPKVWQKINGWRGYSKEGGLLSDASIEPPFLIGHACGSCHISYNPTKPPQNPELPGWESIKGAVGAQYLHISEILASGMPKGSIEWQMFAHARPGTSDTSAVTHDYINNPGTMNSILNLNTRPGMVNTDLPGVMRDTETEFRPQRHSYKYFEIDTNGAGRWATHNDAIVPQILKGGEDNVGAAGAVQRVYLNIGMCAESCMVNHLSDLRVIAGRLSQQTPVRTDQCYRDCAEFRAIGKNTGNIFEFLAAQRPMDLHQALGKSSRQELANELGESKVNLGSQIFAANCARCHSSRINAGAETDTDSLVAKLTEPESPFYLLREDNGVRLDWLGNDARTPATEVGTFRCRSLHTNHKRGNVWEQYASSTFARTPSPGGIPELNVGGRAQNDGRGYYRNISLLSVWAFAPFLHNNAIGPDLCADADFPMGDQSRCMQPDPSVEGRMRLFEASFQEMFKPTGGARTPKITRTDDDIVIPFGPTLDLGERDERGNKKVRGLNIHVPRNMPVTVLGSFDYRKMAEDLLKEVDANPSSAVNEMTARLNSLYAQGADAFAKEIVRKGYVNCGLQSNSVNDVDFADIAENQGHEFLKYDAGATTNAQDKVMNEEEYQALLAFMKLL